MSEPATLFAFDNTWEVIGLVGVIVILRVAVPRIPPLTQWRAGIIEFIDSALIAALLVFCLLRPFVIQAFYIPSGSMEPTLLKNDRILVNKFIYFFREPVAGEIAVFNAPPQASETNKDFIKRVVGVEGDRLSVTPDIPGVRKGGLHRNGRLVIEPYLNEPPHYRWPLGGGQFVKQPDGEIKWVKADNEFVVPPGYVVMMGDNRNNSNDSHRWWRTDQESGRRVSEPYVPRANMLGKAVIIFWPPQRIRILY
jgi:signal peptidase I